MDNKLKDPADNAYLCGRMQARLDLIKACLKVDVSDEDITKALNISVEYVQFLRNVLEQYPTLTQKERAWIAIDSIYEEHYHEEDFWQYDGPVLKRSRKKERKIEREDVRVTKEQEQRMMEEIAEFVLKFGEKYDVLLDIKIKPMKHRKGGIGDDGVK